ncbi:MAG TPA: S8 family peptidase, partial [Luteolibacter sp.]
MLVSPRRDVPPALLNARLADAGFELRDSQLGSFVLASFRTGIEVPEKLPAAIAQLAQLGDIVEFAEPDYIVWPCVVPNDPAYQSNNLWGLDNRGGVNGYTADADIDAPEAWEIRHDASGVVVAITDTGIRYDHQDLSSNMWHNPGEIASDGIDNDGNGVIDDVFGYDAVNGDGDPMDDQGHGTHCAGTIGARGDNGIGTSGVAWNVQLMGCKFLGPFGGTTSDGIRVIDYARQQGANVISASWGGGGYSKALKNAITYCATAGIPFVAAAGNDGIDNDSMAHYPSSYDLPNIVAVAATDASDQLTSFSCYGRNSVDIAAPGWQIWSTYNGSTTDYKFLQGTSMATPHVSGALALARAQFPLDTVDELIDRLYRSADVLPSLEGQIATGGRLNLKKLLDGSGPPSPNDQFNNAHLLEGNFATWGGSNQRATREAGESTFSPAKEARTLWYAWKAPDAGYTTISTHSLGVGQRIVVFSGSVTGGLVKIIDSGESSENAADTVVRFLAESG